jgi:hypothetical protein
MSVPQQRRRYIGVVPLAILAVCTFVATTTHGQTTSPQINATVLGQLSKVAALRYASTLLGIYSNDGDTTKVTVSSNRQLIAFRHAQAAEKGGKFTPPAEMLRDLVIIQCGDPDIGERFDCGRVTVAADSKAIRPVNYSAGPKQFHNALGATWNVSMVTASYPAADLRSGFTITYGDGSGTEWDLRVSGQEAERELLLARDLFGVPPGGLNAEVKRSAFGWRVENLGLTTWPNCVATIGGNTANLGTLEANASIIFSPDDFRPAKPDPQTPPSAVSVACAVDAKTPTTAK